MRFGMNAKKITNKIEANIRISDFDSDGANFINANNRLVINDYEKKLKVSISL